jgi:hypothetical protein
MKIGKAKTTCGFPNRYLKVVESENNPVIATLGKKWNGKIVKDSLWYVPDDYNFKRKESLFTEVKEIKKKGGE